MLYFLICSASFYGSVVNLLTWKELAGSGYGVEQNNIGSRVPRWQADSSARKIARPKTNCTFESLKERELSPRL